MAGCSRSYAWTPSTMSTTTQVLSIPACSAALSLIRNGNFARSVMGDGNHADHQRLGQNDVALEREEKDQGGQQSRHGSFIFRGVMVLKGCGHFLSSLREFVGVSCVKYFCPAGGYVSIRRNGNPTGGGLLHVRPRIGMLGAKWLVHQVWHVHNRWK